MQFNQPDSIIPDPYNSLDWNRYAYARYNPLVYTDPTGHDPILGFIGGFLKEFARTNLWWHPGAQRDLAIHNNESTAELTGRLVADVASIAVGAVEAGGGAGVAGGGVVACGTGVGCLVTPGGLVAGGTLIAQGAGTTLSAANGAGTTLSMLMRGSGNQEGSGTEGNDDSNGITIVEQDGDAIELLAHGENGDITIIANMENNGKQLILNRLHIDGPGAGQSSISELLGFVREFGQQQGVEEVIIYGGTRTTGANPGRVPRPIVVKVK